MILTPILTLAVGLSSPKFARWAARGVREHRIAAKTGGDARINAPFLPHIWGFATGQHPHLWGSLRASKKTAHPPAMLATVQHQTIIGPAGRVSSPAVVVVTRAAQVAKLTVGTRTGSARTRGSRSANTDTRRAA